MVLDRCLTMVGTKPHVDGATEPWITNLVCALLAASGHTTVLETGSFMGHTTIALAETLHAMGGGELTACDIEPDRAGVVQDELDHLGLTNTTCRVWAEDVLQVIARMPDESLGFVFLDDDHRKEHVAAEIQALLPRLAPGGIITFHDVFGSVDLQEVVRAYGGYCLKFPMLGPAGGLGVLQVL